MNINNILTTSCCMSILITIIFHFVIKTTLLWAVWNWSYELIPVLNGPISWVGALLLIILVNIVKITYAYSNNDD